MRNLTAPLFLLPLVWAGGNAETTIVSNDKVTVSETSLAPGEEQSTHGGLPSLLVFPEAGALEIVNGVESLGTRVVPGNVSFEPAEARTVKNAGTSPLRFVRIDFRGTGLEETWGAAGLSPNYKVLIENRYARVYDIRIPAGTREPRHTHKARVVVCLSGAELRHLMADGREEPSTLRTGEIVWRAGGTHIGQNVGATDLRAIAIEPK
jgi:quercetin dioxygenase-like cupin family protein